MERARQITEAVIIEGLTRGTCEGEEDHAAIAARIAGPIQAAIVAERDALAAERMAVSEQSDLLRRIAQSRSAPEGSKLAVVGEAIRAAVAEERARWVTQLDRALNDNLDPASSEVNVHWRARIREFVGARIEAAVRQEREACARAVEHYGYGQVQPTLEHLLSTLAAAIRARGAA